jgi:hypothetical protein
VSLDMFNSLDIHYEGEANLKSTRKADISFIWLARDGFVVLTRS